MRLTILCVLAALGAAFFGFGGVAGYGWEGARYLFVLFTSLAVVCFLADRYRKQVDWD